MAFWSGLFSRKTPTVQKKSGVTIGGNSLDAMIEHAIYGSLEISPGKAMSLYRQSSIVATAVDMIAKKIEGIRPVMKKGDDFDADDEVIDFLTKPNPFNMYRSFVGDMSRNYLLTGNAYLQGMGASQNRLLELYSRSPTVVSMAGEGSDGFPSSYDMGVAPGPGRYERKSVLDDAVFVHESGLWRLYHLRGFTSRDGKFSGDSPLESVIAEIRQHLAGNKHNEKTLTAGARLSMLFTIKQLMPDETFDELEAAILKRYGGENGGSIGVVQSDEIEVQEFGTTNKDMDYVALIEMVKAAVFLRYGIPLPLVTASATTFNNMENGAYQLYSDAVIPVLELVLEALSDFILPRFGRDPRREQISYDPLSIDVLREKRLDELKTLSDLHMLTTNEKRQRFSDLDEVDGGDVGLAPAALVPAFGSGIDPAAMMLEDREAEDEAREAQQANDEAAANGGGSNPGDGNE